MAFPVLISSIFAFKFHPDTIPSSLSPKLSSSHLVMSSIVLAMGRIGSTESSVSLSE